MIRKIEAQKPVKRKKVAAYARVSMETERLNHSLAAQIDYYSKLIQSNPEWEYVDVYFDKENIWTLDSKGELLITIMSSLAQEESRSISENVTWGKRRSFADGKVSFVYDNMLGLEKDKETGQIVVNHEQAQIVKLIYRLFMEGHNPSSIKKELESRGIKTPTGKDKWSYTTIKSILTNEKYKGCALLQKKYTVDFLQKRLKKNEGEIPQYYIEGNHEAIIPPEVFDWVQIELEERKKRHGIFSRKIKCTDCGGWYGAKTHHSNDKYRKIVYQCNDKYKGEKCMTPLVRDEEIKAVFVNSFNNLVKKKAILQNVDTIIDTLCNTESLRAELDSLEGEMEVITEMAERSVRDKTKHTDLLNKHTEKKKMYDKLKEEIAEKENKAVVLENYRKAIKNPIEEFDETLWNTTVDYVTVDREKHITVCFRDGKQI